MDTNAGKFVGPDRAQQWMKRVEVGQQLKILGEEFEVLEIRDRTMVVKLLSFEERMGVGGDLASIIADVERGNEDLAMKEQARHRKEMLDRQRGR
jgi:hypothetical protein